YASLSASQLPPLLHATIGSDSDGPLFPVLELRPLSFGYSAVVHKLPPSPTTGAVAPTASALPRSPPASWHSSLPVRKSAARTAADRCLLHAAPICSAHSS